MNILLLSNGAPNYHHFFEALVEIFEKGGANVTVAVDSIFFYRENGIHRINATAAYTFESYFKSHSTDQNILSRYSDFNLNAALLSDFERAHVFNIWGHKTSVKYFDRLKSALLSFFEMIFDENQIDVVIYENVSNVFSHFALFVTQRREKTYLGLGASRLPGRFSVSSEPLKDQTTEAAFAKIRTGELVPELEVRQWARKYISEIEDLEPDYMKTNGLNEIALIRRYFQRNRIPRTLAILRHVRDNRTDAFQVGNPLITHLARFRRNLARRMRSSRVRNLYQNPVEGESFLLYPLHFHPEASTSILAGTWLDEYEVIRNIAFNLPEGYRLYVKDHPSAWAYPTLDFYRRLRALPNVRLLPPESPTKKLIRSSKAVITLTSTVGYEALLLKRRVFLYGTVFYSFHRGVSRIENPARLFEAFSEEMARPVDWDDAYNEDFVCAYHAATYPGTLDLMQSRQAAKAHAVQVYKALFS